MPYPAWLTHTEIQVLQDLEVSWPQCVRLRQEHGWGDIHMATPHMQVKEIHCHGFYTYRVLPSVTGPLALLVNLSSGRERKHRHTGKLSH